MKRVLAYRCLKYFQNYMYSTLVQLKLGIVFKTVWLICGEYGSSSNVPVVTSIRCDESIYREPVDKVIYNLMIILSSVRPSA